MTFLATLLIGIVAGSRSMMAPAAVAWARPARLDRPRADLGQLHGLALGGRSSSRSWRWSSSSPTSCRPPRAARCRCSSAAASSPAPSAARCSAPPPAPRSSVWSLGAAGAVAGTLGGAALRGRMAAAFGSDRPAALIEDAGADRPRRWWPWAWHDRRGLRRHRHRRRPGRAVARGAPRRRRSPGGARRAAPPRRHLHQHRLPPDQDADRQRQGGGDGAPRRRLRHRRRAGRGRHAGGAWRASRASSPRAARARPTGWRRPRGVTVIAGHARLTGPREVAVGDRRARGRAHLPQRRRPRRSARPARRARRADADQLRASSRSTCCPSISWWSAAATSGSSSPRPTAASAPRSRSSRRDRG